MLRIVGGAFLGAIIGFVVGLAAGVAIAFWLVPPPPGHALDGITPAIVITFIGTAAGAVAGGLLAARRGRP